MTWGRLVAEEPMTDEEIVKRLRQLGAERAASFLLGEFVGDELVGIYRRFCADGQDPAEAYLATLERLAKIRGGQYVEAK